MQYLLKFKRFPSQRFRTHFDMHVSGNGSRLSGFPQVIGEVETQHALFPDRLRHFQGADFPRLQPAGVDRLQTRPGDLDMQLRLAHARGLRFVGEHIVNIRSGCRFLQGLL